LILFYIKKKSYSLLLFALFFVLLKKNMNSLDELFASLDVDKSAEMFPCECGICNICHEINAAILGEYILMLPTTCAEFQENSIAIEFDIKHVDFCREQPLPTVEKLLVEPHIEPRNMQPCFTICASIPLVLSDSQAKCGFYDFHTFVMAGLLYVQDIPPKPPDFLLTPKFPCHILFPISCVRSLDRPPPKPPDMEATIPP
jgi:hypothetical protein